MTITIEKGVPIPPDGRVKTGFMSAIRAMEVGDSLVLPKPSTRAGGYLSGLRNEGRQFTARKIDENSCRIWRIK